MSVQMIGREIQKYTDVGTKLFDQFELKAAQLGDGDGFVAGLLHARNQRRADVACKKGGESGAPQNVLDEGSRRGFPIRAGNPDEASLYKTVGKLNFAPNRDALWARKLQKRRI